MRAASSLRGLAGWQRRRVGTLLTPVANGLTHLLAPLAPYALLPLMPAAFSASAPTGVPTAAPASKQLQAEEFVAGNMPWLPPAATAHPILRSICSSQPFSPDRYAATNLHHAHASPRFAASSPLANQRDQTNRKDTGDGIL